MKSKIDRLIEKYTGCLGSSDFAFGKIQEVISEIQGLPIEEKSKLIELHKEIGQVLLDRGISAKNYNHSLFLKEIDEWKKSKSIKQPVKDEKTTTEDVEKDFDDKLTAFVECIKGQINNLRRYIILKFGNKEARNTKVVFLHDEHSLNPFLDAVKDQLQSRCNCEIIKIKDFKTKLSQEVGYNKNNFITLLIFSPGYASQEEGLKFIEFLPSFFSDIAQINIYDFDNPLRNYKFEDRIAVIKEEIAYLVGIDLSNRNLPPEYEKIIKKLFKSSNIHYIEYKELNSGFSGSKVFEVQPFKSGSKVIKFVIKIDKKGIPRLEEEKRNFNDYVNYVDRNYRMEVEETEKLTAIRYNYASRDQYIDSVAFSEKLDKLRVENPDKTISIIEKLFEIPLFKEWHEQMQTTELDIGNFYDKYIDYNRVISEIVLIKNKKEEEVRNSELVNNFNKIWKKRIPAFAKICHGDLHSENFFVDNNDEIFLIDFGKTGKLHALIDHATLECSIKFRHIPRHIEIEDLLKAEEELLKGETFTHNYSFSSTNRDNLKKYLQIINKIRALSIPYIRKSNIEYFIALFLITFRQIQYAGLNQLYALKSAELLSKKIVDELKL